MSDLDPLRERKDYRREELRRAQLPTAPLALFETWLLDATRSGVEEPNAMTLATVGADGRPHARVVLLRAYDDRGFVFYTNRDSDKGEELGRDPRASITFWWGVLERQIRIEGTVTACSDRESDRYWQSRPRASQISAWASPQSREIESRDWLESQIRAMETRFEEVETIPRPPFWGGFRLFADVIEFWQGRRARSHDRFRYTREESGSYRIARLAP
jgi:pyridoxamine 5'-phosphate oxidase